MATAEFDDFFARTFDDVARTLTLATGDREAARDATQEAFTRALRRWRKVRELQRPDGWVYVTAMNCVRDRVRRERRRSPAEPSPTAPDIGGTVATRISVRDAIA